MRGTFVRKQGCFSLRGLRTTRDAARVSACLNTNYWTPPREFPIQLIWGRTQIFAGFLNPQEGLILPVQGAHWEGCCPVGRDISPGTFFLASGECPRPGGGLCMAALRIHTWHPRLLPRFRVPPHCVPPLCHPDPGVVQACAPLRYRYGVQGGTRVELNNSLLLRA